MNKSDENELCRLTNLLKLIDEKFRLSLLEREALKKAAIALSVAFIHEFRKEVELSYVGLKKGLTQSQKKHLQSMGLYPQDKENNDSKATK